jgi:hypothetical protein
MDSLIMFRTRLMSAVLASVISSSLGLAPPASATEGDAAERGAAFLQLVQACGTLGPYATIRRANEVAYEAGRLGYSTQVFHNGDGILRESVLSPQRPRPRRLIWLSG